MRSPFRALAVFTLLLVTVGTVWADDIYPPPWRGAARTTFADWEFPTADAYPVPDALYNPYGIPTTFVEPGFGQAWWPAWGGRTGVWPLSGQMTIDIPNNAEPLPYKDIWIQLTWASQAPGNTPSTSELLTGTPGVSIHELQLEPTNEPPPAGTFWMHTTYVIHIEPNPVHEIVYISGGIMVDQLVIDTICAPEPTGLWLLAVGATVLLRRR